MDSFFDVFVGISANNNPSFESLLFAEVVQVTPTGVIPIGRFWNLNPQSPEPGTALAVVSLAMLAICGRRRG